MPNFWSSGKITIQPISFRQLLNHTLENEHYPCQTLPLKVLFLIFGYVALFFSVHIQQLSYRYRLKKTEKDSLQWSEDIYWYPIKDWVVSHIWHNILYSNQLDLVGRALEFKTKGHGIDFQRDPLFMLPGMRTLRVISSHIHYNHYIQWKTNFAF